MTKLSGIDVNRADAKKIAKGIDTAISQNITNAIYSILLKSPSKSLPASTLLKKLQSNFEIHPRHAKPLLTSGITTGVLSWNATTKVVTYIGGS